MSFDPTEYQREWRKKNPERSRKIERDYRERNRERLRDRERARRIRDREKINAKARERRQNDPEWRARTNAILRRWQKANPHWWRQIRYGVTHEQAEAMLAAQDGKCAICGQPMNPPHLDHDHATGRVRSFLCGSCNHGLGRFQDRPDLLRLAADYLERQEETTCDD